MVFGVPSNVGVIIKIVQITIDTVAEELKCVQNGTTINRLRIGRSFPDTGKGLPLTGQTMMETILPETVDG